MIADINELCHVQCDTTPAHVPLLEIADETAPAIQRLAILSTTC